MLDEAKLIADRVKRIDASGIRRVFDLAAKIDNPINLSIGQPDFDVPQPIKQAAIDAISAGRNSYTQTQGIAELHEALRARFDTAYATDGRWADYGCLITSGVSGALVLALQTLVNPGDKVLVPDPYFVMYKHLVTLAGGEAVYVDTYPDFQMTAERIEPLIDDRTKLLLLASPSNPTGVVTPPERLKELVELCQRRGVLLVSDEIYDEFCYAPAPAPGSASAGGSGSACGVAPSPAEFSDHVMVLRGFSKTYAMTGWRMGYCMGPRAVVEPMTKLQQYTFVCAPSMVQHAGLAALDVDMSAAVAAYRAKRDRVVEALGERFELTRPDGAFYAFAKVPTGETGTQFVERAIARDLLIIPGCVFSERDTHFRLSYATDDETLERGLAILNDLATQ